MIISHLLLGEYSLKAIALPRLFVEDSPDWFIYQAFMHFFFLSILSPRQTSDAQNKFISRDRRQRDRERGLRDMCMAQRGAIINSNLAGDRGW